MNQREVGRHCASDFKREEGAKCQGMQTASRSWKK